MMYEFEHEIVKYKVPLMARLFGDKWESSNNDSDEEYLFRYTYYSYKDIVYIAKKEITIKEKMDQPIK